jgi:hypothetical protein
MLKIISITLILYVGILIGVIFLNKNEVEKFNEIKTNINELIQKADKLIKEKLNKH